MDKAMDSSNDNRARNSSPSTWSTDELRTWLGDSEWLSAARGNVLTEVTKRLDFLYSTFSPSYPNVVSDIKLPILMPWEPLDIYRFKGGTVTAEGRIAGPLERCFNSSLPARDTGFYARDRELLPGRHPLDDLIHKQLLMAQSYDENKARMNILHDIGWTEVLLIKVLDARFLPPGQKLQQGDHVVCHNLQHQYEPLRRWNGAKGVVKGKHDELFTITVSQEGEEGNAAAKTVEARVPGWGLLPVKALAQEMDSGQPVVLTGLKEQKELNGRLGYIRDKKKSDKPGPKLVVVKLLRTQQCPKMSVLVSMENVVPVKPPPPALIATYCTLSQDQQEEPLQNVLEDFLEASLESHKQMNYFECTLNEVQFYKRCMEINSSALMPCAASYVSKLLGLLDANAWKLTVITAPKPKSSVALPSRIHEELKESRACRNCGQLGSKVKLRWCKMCAGPCYCSKECQKIDWKARHKIECTPASQEYLRVLEAGTPAPACAVDSSPAAPLAAPPQPEGEKLGPNVLLLVHATPTVRDDTHSYVDWTTGKVHNEPVGLQKNQHGDSMFLVKLQNSVDIFDAMTSDPGSEAFFKGPIMVHDHARSLLFFVYQDVTPNAHAALARKLQEEGLQGATMAAGRKLYLHARREGAYLRVFLDDWSSVYKRW